MEGLIICNLRLFLNLNSITEIAIFQMNVPMMSNN